MKAHGGTLCRSGRATLPTKGTRAPQAGQRHGRASMHGSTVFRVCGVALTRFLILSSSKLRDASSISVLLLDLSLDLLHPDMEHIDS